MSAKYASVDSSVYGDRPVYKLSKAFKDAEKEGTTGFSLTIPESLNEAEQEWLNEKALGSIVQREASSRVRAEVARLLKQEEEVPESFALTLQDLIDTTRQEKRDPLLWATAAKSVEKLAEKPDLLKGVNKKLKDWGLPLIEDASQEELYRFQLAKLENEL